LDFLLDPALERDLQGRIAIDPALKGAASATLPRMTGLFSSALLGPLARALKERRVVRFAYQKPSEAIGHEREVEPLELFEWDGMPYLQARDPSDRAAPFKRYALSRMEKLVVLDDTFRTCANASGTRLNPSRTAAMAAWSSRFPLATHRRRPDGS